MDSEKLIGGIDIIRFITAFMVMSFHISFWSWSSKGTSFAASGGSTQYPEIMYLTWFGGVGVQVFFVISGFVIAYSAARKTPLQFLKSRFLRLYPTVWLCAPLTALVIIYIGIPTQLPAGELMLRSMTIYPFRPWIDGVYWSLAVELAFYALVLVLLALRIPRMFEVLVVWLSGASFVYFIGIKFFGVSRVDPFWLLRDGQYFALGIVIWLVRSNGLNTRYIFVALLSVATAYLELDLIRGDRSLLLFCSWIVAWSACVGGICIAAFTQAKSNALTRQLGLMTYPLYLLHNVIGCSLLRLAPDIGRWWALLLSVSVVLTLAIIVARLEPLVREVLTIAHARIRIMAQKALPSS